MTRRRWPLRVFLRLLPRGVRERIAEPALADLLLARRDAPRSALRTLTDYGIWAAECVRLAVPRVVSNRRLTKTGTKLLLLCLLILFVLQRWTYERARAH